MKSLRRIARIQGHRVFREYTWPEDLPSFGKVNVIYGWNGSGKTTLSGLFEHVERKQAIEEGEVVFDFGGQDVEGQSLSTAELPPVRVFNQRFVDKTIRAFDSGVDHIYCFGEESVEKRARIEELEEEFKDAEAAVKAAEQVEKVAKSALDKFCSAQARLIKELLLGSKSHANYDKRKYQRAVSRMTEDEVGQARLSPEAREQLQRRRVETPKALLAKVGVPVLGMSVLRKQIGNLLEKTVASAGVDDLAHDPVLSAWVQAGWQLHEAASADQTCKFCGGTLTAQRKEILTSHFNAAFKRFQTELTEHIAVVDEAIKLLSAVSPPAESAVYTELVEDLRTATGRFSKAVRFAVDELTELKDALEAKKAAPFEPSTLPSSDERASLVETELKDAFVAVGAVVEAHRATTEGLSEHVESACASLESAIIADAYPEYKQLTDEVETAHRARMRAEERPVAIRQEIAALEQDIIERRRPVEELNREVESYLGRTELRFQLCDSGYVLLRNEQPVRHLSEGEKSAIALLYFLKSLQDRSFDQSEGIVVIDDPVSSLDSNAMFTAFAFLKTRTKGCGQLFLLTHSFSFFGQVKTWIRQMPNQRKKNKNRRPGRLYFLRARVDGAGVRSSTLGPLDPLLKNFESEYHYLFRCVYETARSTQPLDSLEPLYGLPNVARRLLEAFLAFKAPDRVMDLAARLQEIHFDDERKTRILRFLHTYSHADRISDSDHDLHLLSEATQVMRDLLDLVEHMDPEHYASLERLVLEEDSASA